MSEAAAARASLSSTGSGEDGRVAWYTYLRRINARVVRHGTFHIALHEAAFLCFF